MLNNLRDSLQPHLQKIGTGFASTGLSPNFWTGVGLLFAFVAAISFGVKFEFALIFAGILLLISGFFDIVDGQVARVTKKTSKKGGFLDSVTDKIAEVVIFLGILLGGYAESHWVLLAITLSLLVSYSRAKAESLGGKLQGIGIGERAERLLVIAIAAIIAGIFNYPILMEYSVILVAIIAGITLIQRVGTVSKNLND